MFVFLARLIIFMVAVSVIRSVIRFLHQAWIGMQPRQRMTATAGAGNVQGATMLQQDPVCGTYVAVDSSLKKIRNGQVIHFCSAECRDKHRA